MIVAARPEPKMQSDVTIRVKTELLAMGALRQEGPSRRHGAPAPADRHRPIV